MPISNFYDELDALLQFNCEICRTAEIGCTLSRMRALPPKLGGKGVAHDSQPTYQIWTQSVKPILRYRSAVWGVSLHVRTCRDTPPVTTAWAVTNGSPSACQISTQSAQPLPRNGRRNICDIPQVVRATCHSGYWHDSALVPHTVEGMGVPTKEDRLSIGLSVPEI